jgi:hypothetical protein
MAKKISVLFNPALNTSFNQKFREKRFAFFLEILAKFDPNQPIKILDVGGLEAYWKSMNFTDFDHVQITLLNLNEVKTENPAIKSMKGDATDLSIFKDNEFDLVFSNSVIEHLFTHSNQQKMANEARRVGKYYFVQTPNYYFPFEPHWLFPFFQYFPARLKLFLTMNFSLGHYGKIPDREKALSLVKEVNLLTPKQMKALFPDGKMYKEYFCGLVKSITMYTSPL